MRRTTGIEAVVVIVTLVAALSGCEEAAIVTAPTAVRATNAPDPSTGLGDVSASVVETDGPEAGEVASSGACDVVQILRAAISWSQVTRQCIDLFVPVVYDGPGKVWIHVWHPQVNSGQKIATGPANETFRVVFPVPCSTYDLQLAAEVDRNGDGRADDGLQCDVHRFTVTLECNQQPVCPAAIP